MVIIGSRVMVDAQETTKHGPRHQCKVGYLMRLEDTGELRDFGFPAL